LVAVLPYPGSNWMGNFLFRTAGEPKNRKRGLWFKTNGGWAKMPG